MAGSIQIYNLQNTSMASCCKFFTIGFLLLVAFLGYQLINNIYYVPPLPNISRTKYWGPGNPPEKQNTEITQFTIEFDPDMIHDLRMRLDRTHYVNQLEGTGCTYGFNHNLLKKIVQYWSHDYNFEDREQYINKYPHFKTNIQGLDIHFIRIKPTVSKKIKSFPLLMLHGWPGSIMEFYKIIPLLSEPTEGNDFVFELVIPSLPGFGWSQAASKPGLGASEIAAVMANLMQRLGFKKYYIQGGDWGSIISDAMATLYPDTVLGYHSNMPISIRFVSHLRYFVDTFIPSLFVEEKFIRNELYNAMYESGYYHIQATKPDSLGAALGDSPAGLAAWILEKFSIATNLSYRERDDAGLVVKFTLTELIDNLMVYWVTNSAATAIRIYAESSSIKSFKAQLDQIPTPVPMAAARFPHEMSYFTDSQLRDKYPNLVQTTDMPRGGHFAAMEEPQLLADDIISAVKLFMKFHNIKTHQPKCDL